MVGLFAGIGGLELGLRAHGWQAELLCENDPGARAVLQARFPGIALHPDVRRLRALPAGTELVAAGFPCQDLSQAGRTAGITGDRSSLVDDVFRLIRRRRGPRWLLIENVPFMLQLDRGAAMRYITDALSDLGYTWAYRVVDARAFGLPQRRRRVLMLASRTEDPRPVLFAGDEPDPTPSRTDLAPCGFYWTEGIRGLGWAVNAVPTLKGGSTIGIASPPAVRLPAGGIVTPGITDGERLQGFAADWTLPAVTVPGLRHGHRWKLVGNAVSVRMAGWVGQQLAAPQRYRPDAELALLRDQRWPDAAWGRDGAVYRVVRSAWPVHRPYEDLAGFLTTARPLSARATAGFLRRARSGSLRFPPGFLDDVEDHLVAMAGQADGSDGAAA
ncbi:DNA cytosine methyltransferase [Skermania piniformis]|uniref:DNA (cytosine-5-)-methyltransferase n=1 Tax=Skermania pinensis TaxID=39122 RepID=A0ABX8SCR6_9ACTN|nr:DNA (cytosine-5-)-methyltransferase [Skermania piniformis]QXQ15598.1 DNA (cytosine-5-)-methyltransferase [Skermania piniformis]